MTGLGSGEEGRFKGVGTMRGFGGCFCDLVESSEVEVSRAEGAEAGGGGSRCNCGLREVVDPKWGSRSRGERGS